MADALLLGIGFILAIVRFRTPMAAITTEEAARRLARVILSDIELYNRERPKEGETLEAQIDEGRRLFATRVSPEIVSIFDAVLADRQNGKANGQANGISAAKAHTNGHANGQASAETSAAPLVFSAPAVPPAGPPAIVPVAAVAPQVAAAPDVAPPSAVAAPVTIVDQPPVAAQPNTEFGNDEITLPGASTVAAVADAIHDLPTSPNETAEASTAEHTPSPLETTVSAALARPLTPLPKLVTPPPRLVTPPPLPKQPTPAPQRLSSTPPQPILVAAVPAPESIDAAAPARVEGPASGSVPVLKVGISIPKILLVIAVAAGLVAVIAHYVR